MGGGHVKISGICLGCTTDLYIQRGLWLYVFNGTFWYRFIIDIQPWILPCVSLLSVMEQRYFLFSLDYFYPSFRCYEA